MNICVIGHFGGKEKCTDGQTIKTREISNYLVDNGFDVDIVDTYVIKKNPLRFFVNVRNGVRQNDAVIVLLSSRGYSILTPYLIRLCRRYNKRIFDFVIGGTRYKLFDNNKRLMKKAACYTKIYVETDRIRCEYEKRGLSNVEVLPNFKRIKRFLAKKDYIKKGELRCCVFSRIIREKGIEEAMGGIKLANMAKDGISYYLDIYGKIDEKYRGKFDNLIRKSNNVFYKGIVEQSKSSEVLKDYDVLIFPSYWHGEGFPGTLIDAIFASLPIVATDWNDNPSILGNEKNGLIVKIKSPEEIADAIMRLAHDRSLFLNISSNNYQLTNSYLPDVAMADFKKELMERKND